MLGHRRQGKNVINSYGFYPQNEYNKGHNLDLRTQRRVNVVGMYEAEKPWKMIEKRKNIA